MRFGRFCMTSAVPVCVALATSSVAMAQPRPAAVADLPLTEVPAASGQTLAIFWSGDGGWAELVRSISKELAANGVAVVGVNARAWMDGGKKTPDDVARDTERLLRTYLAQWSRSRVVLLGYSRGAGFVPFIVNRLPADLRDRVQLVGMLGAEPRASFEFHLMDLVRDDPRATDLPVLPEVQRSAGVRYFCLYGTTEQTTICPQLDSTRARVVARVGDHHFDRNYPAMAQDILRALPSR
jgi:peptidoglycan-N-acetylglucosamine deacetylase